MVQATIFEAERLKQEGMEASYKHSDPIWREAVVTRLHEVLRTKEYFTSDDILIPVEKQGIFTKTNSALGAILTAAKRSGLIEATGQFRESQRPSRHRAAIRLWKSKVV